MTRTASHNPTTTVGHRAAAGPAHRRPSSSVHRSDPISRLSVVDLRSTTTRRQVLIALPALTTVRAATLRIAVTSPSGRLVQIDGAALRKN
jgi:hypothetical protein